MNITATNNGTTAPWDDVRSPISALTLESGLGLSAKNLSRPKAIAAIAPFVQSTQSITPPLIATACSHLGLEYACFDTSFLTGDTFCFAGGAAIDNFIREGGWEKISTSSFARFTDGYPTALMSIVSDTASNYTFNATGDYESVLSVEKLAARLVRPVDPKATMSRMSYVELDGYGYRDDPIWLTNTFQATEESKNEFYPFIEGGPSALIQDFIDSDETVMVWYGEPGTGKTSAVRSAIKDLGILPVMALKEDVLTHKNFIRDIFAHSDSLNQRNIIQSMKTAASEGDVRPESLSVGFFEKYMLDTYNFSLRSSLEARMPVILIEDADILLRKREQGNARMAQLLNEADGLTTNSVRKIIFTTNMKNMEDVDKALLRDGRCYGSFEFPKLTVEEAITARKAAGLPDFEVVPTESIPLATALKKPRLKLFTTRTKGKFGFVK